MDLRQYILSLLILCFITGLVSPACKLRSGQLIEICGVSGVKLVEIPDSQDVPSKHTKADPCMFCFAQAGNAFLNTDVALPLPAYAVRALLISYRYLPEIRGSNSFRPRAPPAFS